MSVTPPRQVPLSETQLNLRRYSFIHIYRKLGINTVICMLLVHSEHTSTDDEHYAGVEWHYYWGHLSLNILTIF